MEMIIVPFRAMWIKQDKPSHVKGLMVSGTWEELSKWPIIIISQVEHLLNSTHLFQVFPGHSVHVGDKFSLVYKAFTLKVLVTITLTLQKQSPMGVLDALYFELHFSGKRNEWKMI